MDIKKNSFVVEILIGVGIILLLTLILYPKFISIVKKSNEATTRANLTALRTAIAVYYGDNNGSFPENVAEVLTKDGKYIKYIPDVYCPPYHDKNNQITTEPTGDSGQWAYQTTDSEDRQQGEFWIDCSHKDTNGIVWSEY
ncbi:MAG: hypothetical protein PHR82_05415 [Endomicrobiaceae bacterium]|nr:hypothetical protein [Endomicrobiaceae bacterium]